MPLYDPKRIGGKVLAGHKPRLSRALSAAAHADALALAERIKTQTHVFAHNFACIGSNRTGVRWEVT